jgi:hypothetical protein
MATESTTSERVSTCRHCVRPVVSAVDPCAPAWVHANTGRASCNGAALPIAEPVTPAVLAERGRP